MNETKTCLGTILVVGDEPDITRGTSRALGAASYGTICVSDARGALDVLKEQPNTIDLILSGICLRDMKGAEFIRLQRESGPLIPVIFYTGGVFYKKDKDFNMVRCIYMYKPFDVDTLHQHIQALTKVRAVGT